MDILTHTFSGVAVATCVAGFVPAVRERARVLVLGAFGGALPDVDAISLWSRFDSTIGKLYSLPMKGSAIYGSKLWYSHHAFFHSLLGSLIIGILLILGYYIVNSFILKKRKTGKHVNRTYFIYFITFVLAYWAHLAGDLPTPSSVWGGIALFWPSLDYVGGYGKIWWWNNYDIFLLVTLCIVINLSILACSHWLKDRVKKITLTVFIVILGLVLYQMNTRECDYAYGKDSSRYTQMEQNSKKEQERILGKKLYHYMESFDKKLKFYF